MKRLLGVLEMQSRSIQKLVYTEKIVYEIPLFYPETVHTVNPTVSYEPGLLKLTFPVNNTVSVNVEQNNDMRVLLCKKISKTF